MTDYQPVPPPAAPQQQPLGPTDENMWCTLAHVGNIIGFLPSLLIMLILGPRSARVKTESREALNFVLTAIAAWIVLFIVARVLDFMYVQAPSGVDLIFSLLGLLVGFVQFVIWVLVIVFSIIAAVRVNKGGSYRYPFAVRLIK